MSEYISSEENFRSFLESSIWRDMKAELNIWLEQIRNALEDPNDDETLESTERLRGAAKMAKRVLAMPEVIMQNIADDKEREEDERRRKQT